jgi:hypothetical protein
MRKKMWTEEEFGDWMSRCGLSTKQASAILGVSESTVIRNRNGQTAVKDDVARRAMAYLEDSLTTVGSDADLLDAMAEQADIADLAAEFEHAVVTGMTSAVLRGWTSANIGFYRQLRQPERRPVPGEWNGLRLEWLPTDPIDLIADVECRTDQNGRHYRIASIERTLVDLAVLVAAGEIAMDDLKEAWTGAFEAGEQKPDAARIRDLAARCGVAKIAEELL